MCQKQQTRLVTSFEIVLVLILAGLIAYPVVRGYLARSPMELWTPLTVISAVYTYYFLLGPLGARALEFTRVINVDPSPYYYLGWIAGIVGLGSIIIGFNLPIEQTFRLGPSFAPPAKRTITTLARVCLAIGAIGLCSWAIGGIEGIGGAFANYVFKLANLLLVYYAVMIWLLRSRPVATALWVGIPFLLAGIGYVQIGFRGPIVEQGIAIIFFWYLSRGERPRLITVGLGGLGALFGSGVMVLTRSYFSGLNLAALSKYSWLDILVGGASDSVTFGALSMVIDRVPSMFPFHYFEFLWVAITFPIPRGLWPGKPMPEYLTTIQYCVDANLDTDGSGMAVPHIGEYYLAFGWPGIVVCCLIFGMFCRWMWLWFLQSRENPLALLTYGAFCGWVFETTHRCHLASSVMTFCFMVLPGYYMTRWFSRRIPPVPVGRSPYPPGSCRPAGNWKKRSFRPPK